MRHRLVLPAACLAVLSLVAAAPVLTAGAGNLKWLSLDGVNLASASAHPGGGVHGAPGAIAARAMLRRGRSHRDH